MFAHTYYLYVIVIDINGYDKLFSGAREIFVLKKGWKEVLRIFVLVCQEQPIL